MTLMLKQHPLGPAYYVVGLAILGMLVGAWLLSQERRVVPVAA